MLAFRLYLILLFSEQLGYGFLMPISCWLQRFSKWTRRIHLKLQQRFYTALSRDYNEVLCLVWKLLWILTMEVFHRYFTFC